MSRLSLAGQQSPMPRQPQPILILVLLLLVTGGVYLFRAETKGGQPRENLAPSRAQSLTPEPPLTEDTVEDLQNHLHHVQDSIIRIQENTKRVERRIHQVAPSLERNYLALERQRLNVAGDLEESILRDSAQALEELELTKQNLKNRRQ